MAETCLLIGDIGGTNARFALATPGAAGFERAETLACADYETADAAIRAYLDRAGAARPAVICLAAAGPIVNDSVRFTNNHWSLDVRDLVAEFATGRVRLLNDFEAIAYSIPSLSAGDCLPVGLPEAHSLGEDDFTIGIIGPGTGLGTGGLCRRNGSLYPIVGEGGHVGFAPETQLQLDVLVALRERYDRVSVERLVSGPGLENLYWALSRIHGEKGAALKAAAIFEQAASGENPRAAEAVQLFFETLGQVAGNLALTLGAGDGIYIAGGIARRYPVMLENSRFRSSFEAKGRHRTLMESIPTQLVTYPEPGLLGAAWCALQLVDA
jgi:glucokinase